MGLPHVLVRFYTNPDGAAARRTTLVVLGLVGLFYLLPTFYGVLGRVYTPQLADDRRHRCDGAACCRTRRSAGPPGSCSARWSPPVRSPPSCPPPAAC